MGTTSAGSARIRRRRVSKATATEDKVTNSDSYLSWEGRGPALGPHHAFLTAAIILLVGKILASAAQPCEQSSHLANRLEKKTRGNQGKLRVVIRGAKEREGRADEAMAKN